MVLYCFQEFLLTLAFPGSIAVCLKAEIEEEPCKSHSKGGRTLHWGEDT